MEGKRNIVLKIVCRCKSCGKTFGHHVEMCEGQRDVYQPVAAMALVHRCGRGMFGTLEPIIPIVLDEEDTDD